MEGKLSILKTTPGILRGLLGPHLIKPKTPSLNAKGATWYVLLVQVADTTDIMDTHNYSLTTTSYDNTPPPHLVRNLESDIFQAAVEGLLLLCLYTILGGLIVIFICLKIVQELKVNIRNCIK